MTIVKFLFFTIYDAADSHVVHGKPGMTGFAFVKFARIDDAIKAKSELIYARPFVVYFARVCYLFFLTILRIEISFRKLRPSLPRFVCYAFYA